MKNKKSRTPKMNKRTAQTPKARKPGVNQTALFGTYVVGGIIATILLVGITGAAINAQSSESSEKQQTETTGKDIEPLPARAYNYSRGSCPEGTSSLVYTLFNVNKNISLGEYVPPDLVEVPNEIDTIGRTLCLQRESLAYFHDMYDDMLAEGMQLAMTSAFRDSHVQGILLENAEIRHGEHADTRVAPPTHSEHQLGTTVDVTSRSANYYSAARVFGETPEYKWLSENAHKYGFIQSYQDGTTEITGYISEPWHWRFVGPDVALEVVESGLTLTEYLGSQE